MRTVRNVLTVGLGTGTAMGILDDLQRLVVSADQLKDDGVPSASIALLEEDGQIATHVITNGHENADTLYQACSISKPITGLAVAKLVDEGRMSYDEKITDYVSETILNSIVDQRTAHLLPYITVGRLLSHTAGLSQGGFPGYAYERPSVEQIFAGQPPSNTPRVKILTFPGSQLSYAGAGFVLVQVMMEQKFGKPFAQIMQETVLKPLGMNRSTYGDLSESEKNFARAHYTAEVLGTDAPQGYWRFVELAAAGLWTTAADLIKVVAAVQESLQLNSRNTFLSRETAIRMLTKQRPNNPGLDMAMGFMCNGSFFAHSGSNDPGYISYFFGSHGGVVNADLPSTTAIGRTGIAILTNSGLGFRTAQKIVAAIFYLKGWPSCQLPGFRGSMTEFVPYVAPPGAKVDVSWSDWVGKWSDGWELKSVGGNPVVLFNGIEPPMRLLLGAAPLKQPHGAVEPTYVIDGLSAAMRLVKKDGERIIELLQDATDEQPQVLKAS